jgi:hypothetical protein
MPVSHVATGFHPRSKPSVLQNQREQQKKYLYHNVRIVERPIPALKPGEILMCTRPTTYCIVF